MKNFIPRGEKGGKKPVQKSVLNRSKEYNAKKTGPPRMVRKQGNGGFLITFKEDSMFARNNQERGQR